jgi:hypothetical protein
MIKAHIPADRPPVPWTFRQLLKSVPMFRELCRGIGRRVLVESGNGISRAARSLANDLFSLLKHYDALAQVGVRMLALGILERDHDMLALIWWKLPRVPLKTGPGRRLTGTNRLEVAWRRLVPGHANLLGFLPLRTGTQ